MSLRKRIAAVAGVAVAVIVVASAAIVYVAVRSNLRGEVERALDERAHALERRGGPPPGRPLDRRPHPPPDRGRFGPSPNEERFGGAAGAVQLISPDGSVERPPGQRVALPLTPSAREIAERGSGRSLEDRDVDGTHLLVLTVGIGERGAAQVARPLTEVDNVLDDVLLVLVIVGGAGIVLAVVLGGVVARTALRPIGRFTRRTEEIAGRPDISERIEVTGGDELGRLAHSFNTTLDALERAVESQRQLVADASHELRTPIASLRANLQTLDEAEHLPEAERHELRRDIIEELDELTALVADVVELARGTRPGGFPDFVRLDEVVDGRVQRARRRGGKEVHYRAELEPTLIRGEPDRLARAVSNLLDNARKWSPDGAVVEVSLSGGTLAVRDHGSGFANEDLPHVFQRFYRAGAARGMSGSGLGLAIVRQTAEAHGGWAEAGNADGGGALLRVRFGEPLPLSPGDAPAGEHAGHA